MSTVELEFMTNPFDAVRFAMSLSPDAIYILSDGEFTDRGRTEFWLNEVNLLEDEVDGIKPFVPIHTIALYSNEGGATLERLANTHGGTYRFVPPPPGFRPMRMGPGGPRPGGPRMGVRRP